MDDNEAIRVYRRVGHFEKGKWVPEETLKIYLDEFPESPREWDNVSRMVCFHGDYNLGDKHDYKSNDFSGWDELKEILIEDEGAHLIYPLSLYDHSGITIFIGEPNDSWDSGRVGFVYVTKKMIEKVWGAVTPETEALAEKCLRAEVKEYDQYIQGNVYGYVIEDADGEEIDSCWGYYGDDIIDVIVEEVGFTEKDGAVEIYSRW
jgi:hypothetical protein